jgi:signal transduction histidine kinase
MGGGRSELRRERLDLGPVVQEVVDGDMPAITAGRYAFSLALPSQPVWVEGDRARLQQVVDNLLHNAIKYTPEGGTIAVRGRADGPEAVIEVIDTGVGIDADTLPMIFDALVQGPTGIDRSQGGLGLGLALVRELTALHGGSVTAHSEGAGKGSTFTLRFPLAA